MNYAGFFTRFFALLIDQIAMSILAFLVSFILAGALGLTIGAESGFVSFLSGATAVIVYVVLVLFQFLYFGYFWSKNGQTVGMKLLNIKIIRQGDEGSISFWRAAFRGTVGYFVSGLVFSLGFIWAAFDGQKEAWHDKLFDTWVVRSD